MVPIYALMKIIYLLSVQIARLTEGYSGADIELLCREVIAAGYSEHPSPNNILLRLHFKAAMKPVRRLMAHLQELPTVIGYLLISEL